MDLSDSSRKQTGAMAERAAAVYLEKHGFTVVDRNVARKTGELDIVAKKGGVLHIVEVKSTVCAAFPGDDGSREALVNPVENLHAAKLLKVVRTGEWYVAERNWQGEWQVDGVIVWLRRHDGTARVRYLPQIL